jgi:Fe-S-cluster containining protein
MIQQFVAQEFCLKCKGCCRFSQSDSAWTPFVLQQELDALVDQGAPPALFSQKSKIQPEPHAQEEGYVCPFLQSLSNACMIYDQRPLECQLYPLLITKKDEKIFLAVDLHCPFIQERRHTPEFSTYVRLALDVLRTPIFQKTIRDNPGLAQEYPDALILGEL